MLAFLSACLRSPLIYGSFSFPQFVVKLKQSNVKIPIGQKTSTNKMLIITHTYTLIYSHTPLCVYILVCVCVPVCLRVRLYMLVYSMYFLWLCLCCVRVYAVIYIYIYMYTYIYIYKCIYIYVCIYICMYVCNEFRYVLWTLSARVWTHATVIIIQTQHLPMSCANRQLPLPWVNHYRRPHHSSMPIIYQMNWSCPRSMWSVYRLTATPRRRSKVLQDEW